MTRHNDEHKGPDAQDAMADWSGEGDYTEAPIPKAPSAVAEDGEIKQAPASPEGADTGSERIPPKFTGGPRPQ